MKYRFMLLITAIVWGGGFVAQRLGAECIGPFTFNCFRYGIGALCLVPLLLSQKQTASPAVPKGLSLIKACSLLSVLLFAGSGLQQIGLAYTTAGKAGFITSLYIVTVPLLGLFFKHPLRLSHVIGCAVALWGLYLLAFHGGTSEPLNKGDMMQLTGVLFWSCHILTVSRFVPHFSGIHLAAGQFLGCCLINALALWIHGETLSLSSLTAAAPALAYSGILAGGVGFTLQILGQKKVPPTEASLLCSLEMIFGALGGVLFLGEWMTCVEWLGCLFMTIGIFAAQTGGRTVYRPR